MNGGHPTPRRRPSQTFLVVALFALAGGDSLVRFAIVSSLSIIGVHVVVPDCYIGSGPAC